MRGRETQVNARARIRTGTHTAALEPHLHELNLVEQVGVRRDEHFRLPDHHRLGAIPQLRRDLQVAGERGRQPRATHGANGTSVPRSAAQHCAQAAPTRHNCQTHPRRRRTHARTRRHLVCARPYRSGCRLLPAVVLAHPAHAVVQAAHRLPGCAAGGCPAQ